MSHQEMLFEHLMYTSTVLKHKIRQDRLVSLQGMPADVHATNRKHTGGWMFRGETPGQMAKAL